MTSTSARERVPAPPRYRALYVFGDSFSDIGARYVDGNGQTAVAYLAQHMGIRMTFPDDARYTDESLNFAASGATTGHDPEGVLNGRPWGRQGMLDQVEDFRARLQRGRLSFDPRCTLFFLAGGLNDKDLPTATTVSNLVRQIALLEEAGARHITLATLPRRIPHFAALGERLNPAYARLVDDYRARPGLNVRLNQWGVYFDEVMENPASFGILDAVGACAGRALFGEDPAPRGAPDTYYYYHEGHPSTAVHRIVGEKLFRELKAE